jgi:hypothetical protein
VSQVTVTDGTVAVGQPGQGRPSGRVVARAAVRGGTAVVERSDTDQAMAVRWREGRRGLAVGAAFPTTPSQRDAAALQLLLVRVAKGLR